MLLRKTLTADQVRQSRVSKLRDKRNQLSDHQWENVLRSTLLQCRIKRSEASSLEKVEVRANLVGDQLSVTFRNNISGITQKLGEIVFEKDETEELDIVRWAGTAVERSNKLEEEVRDLTFRYDEQSKRAEKLNDQLEALIKAKAEHEDSLLRSFRDLLNAKKLKIRDQQRLLASAKIDLKSAAKLQNARSTSKPRSATASRAGKRKATDGHRDFESSEDSGVEGKTSKQQPENDLSEQMNTPEHSDQEETEDENGDELGSAHQVGTRPYRNQGDTRRNIMPLKRGIPFEESRRAEQAIQPATEDKSSLTQESGNEEEETDDDEL